MLTTDEKNFCAQCVEEGVFDYLLPTVSYIRTAAQRRLDGSTIVRAMADEDLRVILRAHLASQVTAATSQLTALEAIVITPPPV